MILFLITYISGENIGINIQVFLITYISGENIVINIQDFFYDPHWWFLFFIAYISRENIAYRLPTQGKHILTTRNQCFYNQFIVFLLLYVFILSFANVCIRR